MHLLRFLLLYMAVCVLLLHNLVPHQHHSMPTASKADILFFQDCPNPADYWERAFSFNPAPEHFESYYPSAGEVEWDEAAALPALLPTLAFYYQLAYLPAPLHLEWAGSHRFYAQESPILSAFVAEIPSLRAPPRA